MLAAGTLWVVLGSRLTFILDDWVVILYRRGSGADAFLQPDNEHLIAGPIAIWKLLLNTVGMGSAVPFRIVSTAMLLLGAWFLYTWTRRRLGDWPALVATIPVLFLGAAFEDFLWFSSITFLGAMACGLGMLVALDRRDPLGDRLACAWLAVSMLFSSLWFAFAAGAIVDVVLRRADRDWKRRAYVVLVPLILYGIWWLGWGHEEGSSVTWHNIGATPIFVLDSIAAALSALLGLTEPAEQLTEPSGLQWGQPLAVAALALGAWRLYKMERIPRSLWVVLAVGFAFWVLSGFAVKPGRVAWASRYQYPGAVFVLLIAAELLRGIELRRRWLGVGAALVVAVSVLGNGQALDDAYKVEKARAELVRADLAAVEIARDTAEPGFFIDQENGDTDYVHVDAGSYLSARDAYGSPAYDASELESSSDAARFAADKVLVAALRFGLSPADAADFPVADALPAEADAEGLVPIPAGACVSVPGGAEAPLLSLPPAGAAIVAGTEPVTDIRMRRFTTGHFSVDFLEGAEPGQAVAVATPPDRSAEPWKMQLEGGAATVCGLSPATEG